MEELARGGQPASKQPFARPVDIINMLGMGVVFVAVLVTLNQSKASEQRGYKNRAVICDMTSGLGLHENPECADPNVTHYRDETSAKTGTTGARNSKATMLVVCRVATALHLTVPECEGIG